MVKVSFTTVALVATMGSPVMAQSVSSVPSSEQAALNSNNQVDTLQASPSTSNGTTDGDIVVTAQRTQSLASKTPVALSAIGGDALRTAGVTDPTNLGNEVPNLTINRANGLQITIRGVTSYDGTEKGDPSAAFLLDGIYIARPQVQETSFFDIARVEVLRGPQGTLYGRNTTAGVVNVITNAPTDRFEVTGNLGVGNYNTWQADAAINVPMSDLLSVRAAVSYDRRNTYLIHPSNDPFDPNPFKNNLSGRLQALFHFSPDLTLLLRGDYSSLKGQALPFVRGTRFFNLSDPRNPVRLPLDTDTLLSTGYNLAQQGDTNNETWGGSGELNWALGRFALTYLGSYREFTRDEASTILLTSPVASQFDGNYRQNSHELRLATEGVGPLKAQIGGYYFREKSSVSFFLRNAIPGTPFYGFPQNPVINETYGFFGQATYSVIDAVRLTGGIRYSHDFKTRTGGTVFQQQLAFNPATDRLLLNYARLNSSKFTYRAGVEWDAGKRTLAYATFSTGYKAGGFNDGCEAGAIVNGVTCNQVRSPDVLYYKPETLNSYEVGLKTRLAGNAVRLNASAFYYDYNNLQLSQNIIVNGGPSSQTVNAARARIKGVEVESTFVPARGHQFDAAFTYLDAYYIDYRPLAATVPTLSYAGRPLDRSPKVVVTAGYSYTLPLTSGADIQLGARTRLSDEYVITAFSVPAQYRQPSFTRTDLTITYNAPGHSWYLQAFGRNLENTVALTGTDSRGYMSVSDPRTYGLRTGFQF